MTVQIILDCIMLICLIIGAFVGRKPDTWVTIVWVLIALLAHIQLKKENDSYWH